MKIKMKIKDILEDDKLIKLSGLNPYCVNEGGADGEEYTTIEVEKIKIN